MTSRAQARHLKNTDKKKFHRQKSLSPMFTFFLLTELQNNTPPLPPLPPQMKRVSSRAQASTPITRLPLPSPCNYTLPRAFANSRTHDRRRNQTSRHCLREMTLHLGPRRGAGRASGLAASHSKELGSGRAMKAMHEIGRAHV